MSDVLGDLYAIMDKAGLNASNILSAKQSTTKTVNQIRTELAKKIKQYIEKEQS